MPPKAKKTQKVTLTRCLKYMNSPDMDDKIPPVCYDLLRFPDQKKKLILKPKIEHLEFFHKSFPRKKIKITQPIHILEKTKFKVPTSLQNALKTKSGFTLTPIIIKKNIYVLLQDAKYKIWHLFTLPGSQKVKNSKQIERKLIDLLEKKFNRDVILFYGLVENQPPKNTFDYYWWPSWLAYLSIRKPGTEREFISNLAKTLILKKDPNYHKFTSKFHQLIDPSSN